MPISNTRKQELIVPNLVFSLTGGVLGGRTEYKVRVSSAPSPLADSWLRLQSTEYVAVFFFPFLSFCP